MKPDDPFFCPTCGGIDLGSNGARVVAETRWRCLECGEDVPGCPGCGEPHHHLRSDKRDGDRCDRCQRYGPLFAPGQRWDLS
jgi:DNA-directed RNA polymerase subunit RPC12/RpoP